ncbi:DNA-binding protein [Virgibacillus senegalensis]|uniref:DNA-binding protein n=1 Tax=Virgibacillus senegalensis TaxID=1499679 RepID=UPI00069EFAE0|nr:DNA-binding protein [Virgibacillus senegalensis]
MMGILLATILSFPLFFLFSALALIRKKKTPGMILNWIIIFLAGFVLCGLFNYLALPALTVPNLLVENFIVCLVLVPLLYYKIGMPFSYKKPHRSASGFLIILVILALPVSFFIGLAALDNSYQSIAKQESGEAEPFDEEDTPVTVSPESARNKVQKAMSVVPNTQFYDLGKLQVQKIDNEIMYVAPVEFTGLWKYLRGKETEGFFTIPAADINAEPEFVQSKMQYTNSSYFNHNVQRTIYNEHPNYVQSGEAQIEVDDEGKPWYIQTLYKPIKLTNKPDMDQLKVAVVDPVSGDLQIYDPKEAPAFIDSPVSSEMAGKQNNYFGKYVHGWLNALFGKKDVKIPNESGTENIVTPIFDNKGEMYYFTDMASPKENIDSALGYTLINARTAELTYYNGKNNNGIMDSKGAKQIVNKEFPEKNWEGSMPILYNVDGNPTWIVNVLDPNGLFKQYAYIKANDSDFVVFGETAQETLAAYRMQLAQETSNPEASEDVELETISGEVNRSLVTSTSSGQSVQFILNDDTTIYTVNASKAPLAIFLQQGDRVEMEVKIRDNGIGTVEQIAIASLEKN